jgi:hypothetical protein
MRSERFTVLAAWAAGARAKTAAPTAGTRMPNTRNAIPCFRNTFTVEVRTLEPSVADCGRAATRILGHDGSRRSGIEIGDKDGRGQRVSFCRLRVLVPALACAVWVPGGAVVQVAGAAAPRLEVVAANLDNPRKIFVGPTGAVFVVEAGSGANTGTNRCLRSCIGLTGSVVKIETGVATHVVTGLGSLSVPGGQDAEGPTASVGQGSRYVVLMQDMEIDSRGVNKVGLPHAGELLSTPPGKVAPRRIADLAAFEAAHNPDRGAGPGPSYAQPSIDSNPYALVSYRGGYAVVDAAGNDLLWVSPSGAVSVLAVFPTRAVRLTSAERRQHRPRAPAVLHVQSVPSSVTVGPDGALYVGEFTGWPYRIGTARIWRVVPGKKPSVSASGFTNISDIAFEGRDLLVLEMASKGLLNTAAPGALIRVASNGTRTVVASTGLVAPTGLAVTNHSIYISNYGTSPASGSGPHGRLVRLGSLHS